MSHFSQTYLPIYRYDSYCASIETWSHHCWHSRPPAQVASSTENRVQDVRARINYSDCPFLDRLQLLRVGHGELNRWCHTVNPWWCQTGCVEASKVQLSWCRVPSSTLNIPISPWNWKVLVLVAIMVKVCCEIYVDK